MLHIWSVYWEIFVYAKQVKMMRRASGRESKRGIDFNWNPCYFINGKVFGYCWKGAADENSLFCCFNWTKISNDGTSRCTKEMHDDCWNFHRPMDIHLWISIENTGYVQFKSHPIWDRENMPCMKWSLCRRIWKLFRYAVQEYLFHLSAARLYESSRIGSCALFATFSPSPRLPCAPLFVEMRGPRASTAILCRNEYQKLSKQSFLQRSHNNWKLENPTRVLHVSSSSFFSLQCLLSVVFRPPSFRPSTVSFRQFHLLFIILFCVSFFVGILSLARFISLCNPIWLVNIV